MDKDSLMFAIPQGWESLDEVQPDGTKDVLCTIKKKSDGTACVVAVEGIEVSPVEDDDEDDEAVVAVVATADGPPPGKAETSEEREKRMQKQYRGERYS